MQKNYQLFVGKNNKVLIQTREDIDDYNVHVIGNDVKLPNSTYKVTIL